MNLFESLFSSGQEIKLIVGLGNPGKKYEKTRHNIGFLIADEYADKISAEFRYKNSFEAELAEVKLGEQKILIAKPQTFMNKSGTTVQAIQKYYRLTPENILIVHDEIDLKLGDMKLTQGSGSAGHRGVESIINLSSKDIYRLRLGIESRDQKNTPPTEAFVLQNFSLEEFERVQSEILPSAIEKINAWRQTKNRK